MDEGAPAFELCWRIMCRGLAAPDCLLKVNWAPLAAAPELEAPKPPVLLVFLLSRSVVFSAMDLLDSSAAKDIM